MKITETIKETKKIKTQKSQNTIKTIKTTKTTNTTKAVEFADKKKGIEDNKSSENRERQAKQQR